MGIKDILERMGSMRQELKKEVESEMLNPADDYETRDKSLKLMRRQIRQQMDVEEKKKLRKRIDEYEKKRTREEVFGLKTAAKKEGYFKGSKKSKPSKGLGLLSKPKKQKSMFL